MENRNEMRRKSGSRRPDEYSSVNVLDFETYSDFGEILYGRSSEEIMKIYSMPTFENQAVIEVIMKDQNYNIIKTK